MMYSDYFALSACAFSVLFMPFLIIAQLRFSHIMQSEGYSNRNYFAWIRRNIVLSVLPTVGVCLIVVMAEVVLKAYLGNTFLYDVQDKLGFAVEIGYVVAVMLISAVIALVMYRYVKCIKIESEVTPIICSKRLINLFLLNSMMVCALITLENVLTEVNRLVMVTPLVTPFFTPLSNLILQGGYKRAKDGEPINIAERESDYAENQNEHASG